MNSIIESNIIDNTIEQLNKKEYKLNIIIRKKETKIDLVKYLHTAYLYPTISTFTKAIANNNFFVYLE